MVSWMFFFYIFHVFSMGFSYTLCFQEARRRERIAHESAKARGAQSVSAQTVGEPDAGGGWQRLEQQPMGVSINGAIPKWFPDDPCIEYLPTLTP